MAEAERGVTVLTPTLPERAALLEEARASVAAQTLPAAAHLVGVDEDLVGPGPVLNRLTEQAETEWLSILADDDLYDPTYLERCAEHFADADIVLTWFRFLGRDGEPGRPPRFSVFDLVNRRETGMAGTFLFRKSLWERLGGFRAGPLEDWDFLVRAAVERARFVPVYEVLWSYRWHGGNVSDIQAALGRGEQPDRLLYLKHYL